VCDALTNATANAKTCADCKNGSGPDRLKLSSHSTYKLTAINNTFFGFTGLPVITTNVVIDGNGTTIVRGGGAPAMRLLAVDVSGDLAVVETFLKKGLARGGNGGNDTGTDDGGGGGGGAGVGGAIFNRG